MSLADIKKRMEKVYISANDLLLDSFRLAEKIVASGFRPDFIIGVWRGGAPVGIAIQEYLEYVVNRLLVLGGAYLALVCLIPEVVRGNLAITAYFGGTSILIIVSVGMDFVQQVQSHLLAHQYEGLIEKSQLRGKKRGKKQRQSTTPNRRTECYPAGISSHDLKDQNPVVRCGCSHQFINSFSCNLDCSLITKG